MDGWLETDADQEVGESEQDKEHEALNSSRSAPAFGEESLEHEWEDDSANGSSCAGDTSSVATCGHEEMSNCCSGWSHDQGCSHSAKKSENDQELKVF